VVKVSDKYTTSAWDFPESLRVYVRQRILKMFSELRPYLWFSICLVSFGVCWSIGTEQVLASDTIPKPSESDELISGAADATWGQIEKEDEQQKKVELYPVTSIFSLSTPIFSQVPTSAPPAAAPPPAPPPAPAPPVQVPEPPKNNPVNIQRPAEPPQLEVQPNNLPAPSLTEPIEQRLKPVEIDFTQRLEKLRQILQENAEFSTEPNTQPNTQGELGVLVLRPIPLPPEQQLPPPPVQPQPPVATRKPIGYLLARVSYFNTNNIFSSAVNPKEDGLIYTGLNLGAEPISLGSKTFLTAGIEGNLIRYVNQSRFNSNQLGLQLNIYQQLNQQMFAEIGWNNQQLFYARNDETFGFTSGQRFFNEHSLRFSLGRRDSLNKKLSLYSFYEFRWSLADPDSRNRLINSLSVSLNYDLLQFMQVGLGYQFGFSEFTQRSREDVSHRIYGYYNYAINDLNTINLQAGVSLGNSTEKNIDFNSWFFSFSYVWNIGRF
jgi:hypothetical protein